MDDINELSVPQVLNSADKNKLGIPPGSAISQGLSNIYLHAFDKLITEYSRNNGDIYYRYTDDICYLSADIEKVTNVKEIIEKELTKVRLKINTDKLSFGKTEDGFNYLGFLHIKQCIQLSNDSLDYIKSNLVLFYKSAYSLAKGFSKKECSIDFKEGFNFWRVLSLKVNSAIRGYNNLWKSNQYFNSNVYGIARYICIVDNYNQIQVLDNWLRRLNKYYCYRICEILQCPKIFIELESLYNWFFRYKKKPNPTIQLAFKKYKSSRELFFNEVKNNNENDYINVLKYDFENDSFDKYDFIIVDEFYYDYEYKKLFKIPKELNLS